ncbi:carbonic anhydrase 2-like [Lineus longissimus]|uniref:carbonic anhydrase 2-like n=1 Tax=Lineus longissimus TaxID=88925 RepID=UPI002B4DA3EF
MNWTDIRQIAGQIWSHLKSQVTSWFGGGRSDMSWGYGDSNGSATWHHNYPHAAGSHQSPVNIQTGDAECDQHLLPLKPQYFHSECTTLVNTGNGVQVRADSQAPNYRMGDTEYRLAQFHFHWGATSNEGSEHTVNGRPYSAELHLVHYNSTKYKTAAEALDKPDGLAVIGVFIKVGKRHHHFQKLCDLLNKIRYKNQMVDLCEGFDLMGLLPHDLHHYWTYAGSLTTPPCYQSVRWLVLMEPIEFSEDQLEAFRQMELVTEEQADRGDHARCLHNFRPTQPLNDRKISSSF